MFFIYCTVVRICDTTQVEVNLMDLLMQRFCYCKQLYNRVIFGFWLLGQSMSMDFSIGRPEVIKYATGSALHGSH